MIRVERHFPIDMATVDAISRLDAESGHRGLSDDFWAELHAGAARGALAFEGDRLIGYAHHSLQGETTTLQILSVGDDTLNVESALLRVTIEETRNAVRWWVMDPSASEVDLAASVGFDPVRELLQMRVALPVATHSVVATRPFKIGVDNGDWLRVNNRAFASHPEQGMWTPNTLEARIAEPWFDPNGFLLHEIDGQLAAFCWTKIHTDSVEKVGEIYVIAVDPVFHGQGLGRALTEAGLASIYARSVGSGMLYVDATNTAAVRLYTSMGFALTHTNVLFAQPSS